MIACPIPRIIGPTGFQLRHHTLTLVKLKEPNFLLQAFCSHGRLHSRFYGWDIVVMSKGDAGAVSFMKSPVLVMDDAKPSRTAISRSEL